MNTILATNKIDLVVVVVANISNLIMVLIFLSRPFGWSRFEHIIGLFNILLGIPLLIAVILNFSAGREWWTYTLPVIMILFLIVELVLDYVLQVDFRNTWMLWPYLILFYFSQWMLIGYAFLVANLFGAITLVTYFMSMGATIYSYSRVGHGRD